MVTQGVTRGILTATLLLAASCGSGRWPDTYSGRCQVDGLCITQNDGGNLSGGFRSGDREVGFDVAYSPSIAGMLMGGRPYCARLAQDNGHVFYTASNSACPPSWSNLGGDPADDTHPVEDYRALLPALVAAMRARPAPPGYFEQWNIVIWMAEDRPTSFPTPEDPANPRAMTADEAASVPTDPRSILSSERLDDDNRYRDPIPAREDVAAAENVRPPASRRGAPNALLKESFTASGHGWFTPAQRVDDGQHDYRQVIELWSQNVKSMLLFGWKTKSHHSATKSYVFRRPSGSQAPWTWHDTVITSNHGAWPGQPGEDLSRYETCNGLPTTHGWYATGGECEGDWFTHHLCNDDTAFQLYHAWGGWNGGHTCWGKRRFKRIGCAKPW